MRVFLGTAEWWEPILPVVILLVATAIVIGSRIYGNSLLRMGGRVMLRDALARGRSSHVSPVKCPHAEVGRSRVDILAQYAQLPIKQVSGTIASW